MVQPLAHIDLCQFAASHEGVDDGLLRIKAERKHREAEKQYEAFCKRNGINNE